MKITIYSTAQCAACETLTTWLDRQGLKYEKKVTDEDPDVMDEFMAVNDGMIGVPFTVIENDKGEQFKVSGYDQSKLKQALSIG